MKNVRRVFVVVVTAALMVMALTSCGTTKSSTDDAVTVTTPSELAMLYADAYRGHSEGLRADRPDTSWDDSFVDGMADQWAEAAEITFTDEQRAVVADAYRAAFDVAQAKVIDEKIDGRTATVRLSVNGVDTTTALDQYSDEISAAVAQDDAGPALAAVLDKALRSAKAAPDPIEIDLTFTKAAGRWNIDSSGAVAFSNAFLNRR